MVGPTVHDAFAVGMMHPTDDGKAVDLHDVVVVFGVN